MEETGPWRHTQRQILWNMVSYVGSFLDPTSRMTYENRTGTKGARRETAGISLRVMNLRSGAQSGRSEAGIQDMADTHAGKARQPET